MVDSEWCRIHRRCTYLNYFQVHQVHHVVAELLTISLIYLDVSGKESRALACSFQSKKDSDRCNNARPVFVEQ